jgi:Ni/Co efflux regulator RcnB
MKKTLSFALALTLLVGTGAAFAQTRDDRDHNAPPVTNQQRPDDRNGDRGRDNNESLSMRGPRHADWRAGGHIARDDWGRGAHVDYRTHHLRRPPRGYEWREVDGNYVMAAVATGLIASIILANH